MNINMKKKVEAKYLDKEWDKMNVHLSGFLESGDQEELHKFRVQVKKLHAMLSLFEIASRQHGLVAGFKPVKKIFKAAGNIREAYTNLQLGARFNFKNDAFEAWQRRIMEEGTKVFTDSGKHFLKQVKDTRKAIKRHLRPIDDSLISEFYKMQLEQIANELMVPQFTESMHSNRKKIKTLLYNHKLADNVLTPSLFFNNVYMDTLQDSIGEWHDNIVIAEMLASPELNDKPLIAKIKRQNVKVKHKIIKLADNFWKKATTLETAV
ncbi:hypothetical protein BH09BAC6_BH09BAC6_04520 [soil metagenome]